MGESSTLKWVVWLIANVARIEGPDRAFTEGILIHSSISLNLRALQHALEQGAPETLIANPDIGMFSSIERE